MDQDDEQGGSIIPRRPKSKRMSSIKKLGKFLGITSKSKVSKRGKGRDCELESSEIDSGTGHWNSPSIPIAKVLENPTPYKPNSMSETLFSRLKSFYSTNSGSIGDPNMPPIPPAPAPRNSTDRSFVPSPSTEVVKQGNNNPKTTTDDTACPLIISTGMNVADSSDNSFHSTSLPLDIDDGMGPTAAGNHAHSITTHFLRAALAKTQIRLVKVLPPDIQALLNGDGSPSSQIQRARRMSRTREVFSLNSPLTQLIDKLHFDYEKSAASARRVSGSSSFNVGSTTSAPALERYSFGSFCCLNSRQSENGDIQSSEQEDWMTLQRVVLKSGSDLTRNHNTRPIPTVSATAGITAFDVNLQVKSQTHQKKTDNDEKDIASARGHSRGWSSSSKKAATPATALHISWESCNGSRGATSGKKKTPGSSTKRIVPSVYARQKGSRTPQPTPPVVTSKSIRDPSTAVTPTTNVPSSGAALTTTPVTTGGVMTSLQGSKVPSVSSAAKRRPSGIPTKGEKAELLPCQSDFTSFPRNEKTSCRSGYCDGRRNGIDNISPIPVSPDLLSLRPA